MAKRSTTEVPGSHDAPDEGGEPKMDTLLFGDAATLDRPAMVERVAAYAKRSYAAEVDGSVLEEWAEEAVAHVWGEGVQVTAFVPMLALREIRERVLAARAAVPAA
jgi:hypothetical protein